MGSTLAKDIKGWHDKLTIRRQAPFTRATAPNPSYRSDEVDEKIPETFRDLVRDISKRESTQRWHNFCRTN